MGEFLAVRTMTTRSDVGVQWEKEESMISYYGQEEKDETVMLLLVLVIAIGWSVSRSVAQSVGIQLHFWEGGDMSKT